MHTGRHLSILPFVWPELACPCVSVPGFIGDMCMWVLVCMRVYTHMPVCTRVWICMWVCAQSLQSSYTSLV